LSIPRHHSTEQSARARGHALGVAHADRIRANSDFYGRLFETTAGLSAAGVGRLSAEAMERIAGWAPELADEIEGIAAGCGLPIESIAALNARTELLAGAACTECSTIAVLGTSTTHGRPIGLQTWDWHEELAGGWIVWTIEHPEGRVVKTLTEAGIVGKIGVSSAGVGLLLNILGHDLDGPPVGVPVHVICRRVLDEADGAVAALELLAGARVSASSAVTLVAADEDGGVVCTTELSPAGPGFALPDDDGVLVHTNHFVSDPGRANDRMVREAPDTVLRFDHARRGMRRVSPGSANAEVVLAVMNSHRAGPGAICCHPSAEAALGERWATLATITVDPQLHEMHVVRGGPCGRKVAQPVASEAAAGRASG
jgi:isopenicillin-N N-acyltransferase like protein